MVGAKSTVSPPLQPIGAGRYFGVARLDSGPVREMRAVIERNGEQLGVTVPWTVSAATDTAGSRRMSTPWPRLSPLHSSALVVGWIVLRRRRAEMKLPDMAEWELVTASSHSVRATATSSDPLAEVIDLDRRPEHEP